MRTIEDLIEAWVPRYQPVVGVKPTTGREIDGATFKENLEFFGERTGNIGGFINNINNVYSRAQLRIPVPELSEDMLLDGAFYFSDELNLLSWLVMKSMAGNSFCFKPGFKDRFGIGHKIYESAPFNSDPFVKPGKGEGVKGSNFASAFLVLKDILTSHYKKLGFSGRGMVSKVDNDINFQFQALNVLVGDGKRIITPEHFTDGRLMFGYEPSQVYLELCKVFSGKSDFTTLVGRDNFPFPLRVRASTMNIQEVFKLVASYGSKYNSYLSFTSEDVGLSTAIVRVSPTPDLEEIAGPYFHSCMLNSCDIARNVMSKIPEQVYGMKLLKSFELSCCSGKELRPIPKSWAPHLESDHEGDACRYFFEWSPTPTGLKKHWPAISAYVGSTAASAAVIFSDMPPTTKTVSVLLSYAAAKLVSLYNERRHLRKTVPAVIKYTEQVQKDEETIRHELLERELRVRDNLLKLAMGGLYEATILYNEYNKFLEAGEISTAQDCMRRLQTAVGEYLEDTILSDIEGADVVELRKKLDDASLLVALGEVVDGTINPLTGKSGSSVFIKNVAQKGDRIYKRFAYTEMGAVEVLAYEWFSTHINAKKMFPTPDILAYKVLRKWNPDIERIVDVPLMMIEQIEGPTLYDFFRQLNNQVEKTSGEVSKLLDINGLKDAVITNWIHRYCYLAEQVQSDEEGSLGELLKKKNVMRISNIDYAGKIKQVFDECLIDDSTSPDVWESLYAVADMLGEAFETVKKVPFIDMGPLNGSMPAKELYSHILSLCRGVEAFDADMTSAQQSVEDTTHHVLEEIISNMSDPERRKKIYSVCANELVRFDFEKLTIYTLEFDDLSHITDFLPYDPSPEQREKLNALYIAARYTYGDKKVELINLIKEGKTGQAISSMREMMDYEVLESQRALVAVYRNLRWIRFYSDLDIEWDSAHSKEKTLAFHRDIVVSSIDRFLELNGGSLDVSLDISHDSLQVEGLSVGLAFLRTYLGGDLE